MLVGTAQEAAEEVRQPPAAHYPFRYFNGRPEATRLAVRLWVDRKDTIGEPYPIMVRHRLAIFGLLTVFAACTVPGPRLVYQVSVPDEHRETPFDPPPNGQTEPVRYRTAYRAFWWNCVMVKAGDLNGRCPFICSGTAAAAAGCVDGTADAENQIGNMQDNYSEPETRSYLRSYVSGVEVGEKLSPYFDAPSPEIVN